MKVLIIPVILLLVFSGYISATDSDTAPKPSISFTFDDGSIKDMPGYNVRTWNRLILAALEKNRVKAVLFIKGSGMDNKKGKAIIESWSRAGHLIGNHTYSHYYYNSKKVSIDSFKADFLKNDRFISKFSTYTKIFRFPYLKEGNSIEKRDGFRKFLKRHNYRNGYVTIDASDWYVNSRLLKRLKKDKNSDIEGFRKFYIKHLYARAEFYDNLAYRLTGRRVKHNILLHHNFAAALFLDDLIKHFRNRGWNIIDAEEAYNDPVYKREPDTIPAGESLIWSLAKESGRFEKILRYPAEDSRYEKEEMDALGL